MSNEELNDLVERKKRGELGLDRRIVELIAADAYKRPWAYGLESEDEVGEVFVRYWTRIGNLADRYEDTGYRFESFAISSFRYMALSLNRQRVCRYDREGAIIDDETFEAREDLRRCEFPDPGDAGAGEGLPEFPGRDDSGIVAVAFRRRVVFLCVKCAHILDDGQVSAIASAMGLDLAELRGLLARARERYPVMNPRIVSRRRGRNVAWIRMGAAARRLARETDADARRYLREAIDRERGLYLRAARRIARTNRLIPNKAVAELLGIPKGTVDCGVGRVLRKYSGLPSARQAR
jgi:hypothetical protein